MRATSMYVLAGLYFGSAGCSLVNLSGDIEQAQCASHDDCDVLNDRGAASFDPCTPWQCAQTSLCERYPLDLDHDGFSPHVVEQDGEELVCENDPSRRDCADEGGDGELQNPDEPEACDSLDNDCDGRLDEGVLDIERAVATVFADENADGTGEATYAIDPDSGTIAVAYGLRRGASSVPAMSTIEATLASGSAVSPLALPAGNAQLFADSVGVGALGGDRFAVAFVNESGGLRLVAGIAASSGRGLELHASEEVLRRGLRCAQGESCASNAGASMEQPTVPAPITVTPALRASGDDVLVVYARAAEGDGACAASGADAEPAPVLANALVYNARAGSLTERDAAALSLGETTDRNTPAVIELPELGGQGDHGFLVAFANPKGEIELRAAAVREGMLTRSEPLLVLEQDDRLSDVSLVLGEQDGAVRYIGLAAQAGCGADARVVFHALELSFIDGALRLEGVQGPIGVGGAPNETRPSVAWSAPRRAFMVAYRDGSGLRARVLTRDGVPLGDGSYDLLTEVDSGDGALRVATTPFAVPYATVEGWFGVAAGTERAEDHVLQTITLSSCR